MKENTISIGFNYIDNSIGGLVNSDLICIASRPTVGKGTLALNIVSNVVKQQIPTLIFSLDNNKESIKNRIMIIESAKASDFVEVAKNLLSLEQQLYIYDSILNILGIEQMARKLKQQENIGLIIIDYLQLIKSDKTIEDIIKRLKKLAEELNIPIIVLSQLSKELESREDKRPVLSDFKNSSVIVDYADTILFVYRDDFYDKDSPMKDIVEIIIAKSKSGDTGTEELINVKTRYINLEKRFEKN